MNLKPKPMKKPSDFIGRPVSMLFPAIDDQNFRIGGLAQENVGPFDVYLSSIQFPLLATPRPYLPPVNGAPLVRLVARSLGECYTLQTHAQPLEKLALLALFLLGLLENGG